MSPEGVQFYSHTHPLLNTLDMLNWNSILHQLFSVQLDGVEGSKLEAIFDVFIYFRP